jgi:hypothetical protein
MNDTPSTITAALREAADLLDQRPQLPQPYITNSYSGRVNLAWYLHIDTSNHPKQKALAALIVKTLGGKWDKGEREKDFDFYQSRDLLDLHIQVDRPAVCERVVVGTETRTVPAVEAQPERTETVEKVEWRCQPLLADDHAEAVAVSA